MYESGSSGMTKRGYEYATARFFPPVHRGTHIDNPQHFSITENALNTFPHGWLSGEATVLYVCELFEKTDCIK